MMMAMKDGKIMIKQADATQSAIIKSWNKMKWIRSTQMLVGDASDELLNRLASLVRLPAYIEEERKRRNRRQLAVNTERTVPDPRPLVRYPVKKSLYLHQIRSANMALVEFGLVDPAEVLKGEGNGE